jgi:NAD(P)H-dependent flavin oxidoreductase YrpB (nitropropane dioxygenase family)
VHTLNVSISFSQAGMGAYVSNWALASAVASDGDAIGMVSGVAMDHILVRKIIALG